MTLSRTIKFSLAVFLFLVLGAIMIFAGYGWFLNRMARVDTGTARPTFPYSDYSVEELNKLYPQYITYDDVPTIQTPEQTHQKFLEALKREDFDEAARCCFKEGDWDEVKSGLLRVKQSGELITMIKNLDTKIEPNIIGGTRSTYEYSASINGKKVGSTIDFIKNSQGIWLIESL